MRSPQFAETQSDYLSHTSLSKDKIRLHGRTAKFSNAHWKTKKYSDAEQHVRRNEGSAVRMSLDLERFGKFRPWLFHLTARANLCDMRATGMIECAGTLLRRAGHDELLMVRRESHMPIEVDSHQLLIRDQKPLHEKAIAFEIGWDLPRFVRHVNDHVFFWPGSVTGPIKSGLNHYQRYANEELAIVRVQWWSILHMNPGIEPLFSRFNSGAPPVTNGKHSPRGSGTYRDRYTFDGGVSDVVEVVFQNRILLPCDTQVSPSYRGPWKNL